MTVAPSSLFSPPDCVSRREETDPSSSGPLAGGRSKESGRWLGCLSPAGSLVEFGPRPAMLQGSENLVLENEFCYICPRAPNTGNFDGSGDTPG